MIYYEWHAKGENSLSGRPGALGIALGVEPGAKEVARPIVALVGIPALIELRGTAVGFEAMSDTDTVGGADTEEVTVPDTTDDVAVLEAAATELDEEAA